jgi:DNA-binding transcriptional MerR regulator
MKGLPIMQPRLYGSELQIPSKLYRIGELVRYTPFSRQTIHNYTIMGLISETEWTEGGHRLYDESVFERLSKIIQLKRSKTLSEIRQILSKEQTGVEASPRSQKGDMTSGKTGFTSHSAESTKPQSNP